MNIAVVGLGFGAAFVPIYRDHPDVDRVFVVDTDEGLRARTAAELEVDGRIGSLGEVLASPAIDAVHLATPIPLHAEQTVAALAAGKHVATSVPAGSSIQDLQGIVSAERSSTARFMMLETAVYSQDFLFAKALLDAGDLGRIQFLRGVHHQVMDGWPAYWRGLPPMLYATHAIAPLLALAGTRAATVRCLGSGTMRRELHEPYGNPYPLEVALFTLHDHEAVAEVTRSHFEVARQYVEGFSVYGSSGSFECPQLAEEEPVQHRLDAVPDGDAAFAAEVASRYRADSSAPRRRRADGTRVPLGEFSAALPPSIQRYAVAAEHGGSHPHLVHEFVSSVVERRPSAIDAVTAAQWTAAGICAHQSAMRGGETVRIPSFDD